VYVPLDGGTVADPAHEGRKAAVRRVDGQPSRPSVAVDAKRVRDVWRYGHAASGGDGDLRGLMPDPEDERALEDVESVDVIVMDVSTGHIETGRVFGVGDGDLLAGYEDLDLALLALKNRLGRRRGENGPPVAGASPHTGH
jgi:hypothetical protein